MRILSIIALVSLLSGCGSGQDPDKSVTDASPGGSGGTGGGGNGGAAGAADAAVDGFADDGDPCAPNLGRQPAPLVDGSSPECPRCSPYSQSHWDPSCGKPGLVCEYQQHGGGSFGAFCRCGGLDADAGAPPDGAPLQLRCGL
jgi:hypothetical protein